MTYRKGSMGEADAKANKIGLYVLAGVFVILLAITFIPGLFTHDYFTQAAGWLKGLGVALTILWAITVKKIYKPFMEDTLPTTGVFAGLIAFMMLAMFCFWGFKFDL